MSKVEEFLRDELEQRAALSIQYKQKIDTAKTQYKREYYNKKIRENNRYVASLLEGFDRIMKNRKDDPDESTLPDPEKHITAE